MATITKVQGPKGSRYRVQIRRKEQGEVVYSEARSFSAKAPAAAWARRREAEIDEAIARGEILRRKVQSPRVSDLLSRYLREQESGRSKYAHIRQILGMEIADLRVKDLTVERLIDHLRGRNRTASPATVNNDMTWLRVVLDHARVVWGEPIDMRPVWDATSYGRKLRLIGTSKQRDRRPTADEMKALLTQLARKDQTRVPMVDIVRFAALSSRRLSEITHLRWVDLDEENHTCLLRDVKNPKGSAGNHRVFRMLPEALEILKGQPRTDDRIFPYQPNTVGAYFHNACKILEIEDLRFHDLRHEATSMLFERGYQIQEVQLFTLHEEWKTLKRYTQLRPSQVPYL